MFIVSTHRNLGITNVNQVPNIYIAENRAITVYFRDNDSQYVIYSDPETMRIDFTMSLTKLLNIL